MSKVGERDHLQSPDQQRESIEAACLANGWVLVDMRAELDLSGRKELEDRRELSKAVEAIEAGEASVIVGAYFDRLLRSTNALADMRRRVEVAKGGVYSVDHGWLTNRDAMGEFQTDLQASLSKLYANQIAEKSTAARERAVKAGKAVGVGRLPLGYLRGEDQRLIPDPATKGLVQQMFALRASGGSVADCQRLLADAGHERVYNAVKNMLCNRLYLGEIHHGDFVNLKAHDEIIDADTWRRAQRAVKSRPGRKAKSGDRLLSRLGLLRCGTCKRAMVCDSFSSDGEPRYRCTAHGVECARKVSIKAGNVEAIIIDVVKDHYPDVQGNAAANITTAEQRLADAQAKLDKLVKGFTGAGLLAEPSAVKAMADARTERDAAQEDRDSLPADIKVTLRDWDLLSEVERRQLLRDTIASISIAAGIPGRAGVGRDHERVTVTLK